MRVTLVIYSLGAGGAERVLTTMANYWADKGWVVNLITFTNATEPPFYRLHPGVIHIPLGTAATSRNAWQAIRNNFRRVSVLREAIRRLAPEAVISFMDSTNVTTLLAAKGLGVPVIVSERCDPRANPMGRGWEKLRKLTYPTAAKVVMQTDGAARYFSPRIRNRVRVIPNPIDTVQPPSPQRNGKPNHAKNLIAMGRLTRQKGFDLLVQAFARVAAKHPDWSLTIWGEGEERISLETLVNDLGLGGRVRLPGRTSEPRQEMQQADLFVLSSRYEGFPNVLCEALACGLPALAFDCPSGPREILGDTKDLLIPAENVVALAQVLDRLMGDERARRLAAEYAPGQVERYTLPRVMNVWEELLMEVVR